MLVIMVEAERPELSSAGGGLVVLAKWKWAKVPSRRMLRWNRDRGSDNFRLFEIGKECVVPDPLLRFAETYWPLGLRASIEPVPFL